MQNKIIKTLEAERIQGKKLMITLLAIRLWCP